MYCTPLIIYVLFAIIYFVFLIVDYNNPKSYPKKKSGELFFAIGWLLIWGFIIGWFCYDTNEAAAWWLLVLPWILGLTIAIFMISMLYFLIAIGECLSSDGYSKDYANSGQYKYSLEEIQEALKSSLHTK